MIWHFASVMLLGVQLLSASGHGGDALNPKTQSPGPSLNGPEAPVLPPVLRSEELPDSGIVRLPAAPVRDLPMAPPPGSSPIPPSQEPLPIRSSSPSLLPLPEASISPPATPDGR